MPLYLACLLKSEAVAIMRCSGENCLQIAQKLFLNSNKTSRIIFESHVMNYGYLWDEARRTILDEIYLSTLNLTKLYG